MAALSTLNGSTLSFSASVHFCLGVSGVTGPVESVIVWKSGITPNMRLSLRGDTAAAETGSARGTSAKSVGASVCAAQPMAAQRATTGATWAVRITGCQGAMETAVVTLSLETAPKG